MPVTDHAKSAHGMNHANSTPTHPAQTMPVTDRANIFKNDPFILFFCAYPYPPLSFFIFFSKIFENFCLTFFAPYAKVPQNYFRKNFKMTIEIVPEFHSLILPEQDGIKTDEWCSFDTDASGVYYLLNTTPYRLCKLLMMDSDEIDNNLHFATPADCHFAMNEYYTRNGVPYPYMAEWKVAIENKHGFKFVVDPDELESEPMDFT